MPANGHFSGRMDTAIKRTIRNASGREGKFYSILNKYGYYDVNDEKNGLTKEQREQVPVYNQNRMTQLCNAIADMFTYVLADEEDGVITQDMQGIVDAMDTRSSANAAQLNAIGTALSAAASTAVLAPLASIDASRKIAEAQTASVMGSSPFNADMIPPIAIGLDGLPVSIGNAFKSGFFQPNWDFLYQQEPIKKTAFYAGSDGKIRLGANILLDQGGNRRDLFLKNVFAVNTIDKNLAPTGDVKGGLTAEQFTIVRKASTSTIEAIKADSEMNGFTINDSQMQASFMKYVQGKLWDVINNRQNWAHSHWGALTNNSCPEYVKTAVSSFLWTNGLAIDPSKSSEAGFISYCLTVGVYYLIGYQYSVNLYAIAGLDKIIGSDGKATVVTTTGQLVASKGLAKSETIANQYFTWIADILIRLTYSTNSDTTDIQMRKRRVAEANLIYKGIGKPTVSYGESLSKLDIFHSESGLRDRQFDKLMSATVLRYANEGVAGGKAVGGALATPEPNTIKIKFDSGINPSQLSELSANVIKTLANSAGITEVTVTSLHRPPEIQATTMFNNLQKGNRVSYAPAGRAIVSVYDTAKVEYDIPSNKPFTDATQIDTVKTKMIDAIKKSPPEKISKHGADPAVVQAVDISPTRITPSNKSESFRTVCMQAKEEGIIRTFLGPNPKGPGSDPAYHIEIWQNDKAPKGFEGGALVNNAPPTVQFAISNTNLKKSSAWVAPFAKDHNDSMIASKSSEEKV